MLLSFASMAFTMEPCPDKMQAVLAAKIIPFIKGYDTAGAAFEITLGILGNHEITSFFQLAAQKLPYKINIVNINEKDLQMADIKVVYIPSGTSLATIDAINTLAKKGKILTICGDPTATLDHNMTLSFYVQNDKPKVLVNMKSAKEEGIVFSSKLLGLADTRNME